jgi:Replication-relaxation
MKPKRAPQAPIPAQPLTPTEEEMLRIISVYRYMTALDMAYRLGTPKTLTRVRSRLTRLAGGTDYQERSFLYRFPLPSSNKGGNRERVFTLGAAGREVVESLGMPVDWYYRPSKTGRLSGSHLAHQLLVTRFVVAAQQWTNQQPDYSLAEMKLSFEIARHLGKQSGEAVVPDAWLHFARVGGRKSPVLLEIDRGTEYQERFKNHIRGRIEFIRSGEYARIFGTQAVSIAYGTTGQVPDYAETRRKTMAAWTMEVLEELELKSWAGVFHFTTVVYERLYEDAQTIFTKPVWYRPDSMTTVVPLLG